MITGAASGIGLATAIAFAERGDFVYAGVRNVANTPHELNHDKILPLKLDITSDNDIETAISMMKIREGLPDILINNAGINIPGTIEECSKRHWDQIFKVNFVGPINLTQKILPNMRNKGSGTIIMLSSLSAEIGLPFNGPYAASKAALNRASESLAYEVKRFGIKITILEPAAVNTNLSIGNSDAIGTLEEYNPLNEYMSKAPQRIKNGAPPETIANEIVNLAYSKDTPILGPLGDNAREGFHKIGRLDSEGREQLVRDVTDLAWWIDGKH